MREHVLLVALEFGHRAIESLWPENRVVPESGPTAWRQQDFTRATALCDLAATVRQCHRRGTEETRAAGRGRSLQFLQQRLESTSIVEVNATIPRRIRSRSPTQGIDFEPRVVGHTGHAGFPRRHPCLDSRVLEIITALRGKFDRRKVRQRDHFEFHEDASNLATLPGVPGSDDETPERRAHRFIRRGRYRGQAGRHRDDRPISQSNR